jgi:hypothetical protein
VVRLESFWTSAATPQVVAEPAIATIAAIQAGHIDLSILFRIFVRYF